MVSIQLQIDSRKSLTNGPGIGIAIQVCIYDPLIQIRVRSKDFHPGLMCDVESYTYLPLLEETGYMPKRRYASGYEIRQYVEELCERYGLRRRAMFQSRGRKLKWNEKSKEWVVDIVQAPKGGKECTYTVRSRFILLAPGCSSFRDSRESRQLTLNRNLESSQVTRRRRHKGFSRTHVSHCALGL